MKDENKKPNIIQDALAIGMSVYNSKDLILEKANKVFQHIHNDPAKNVTLTDIKDYLLSLSRLLKAFINGEYKEIAPSTLLKISLAIAYFSFGKDLIPDDLPGIGMIDDILVLSWSISSVLDEIKKFEEWENKALKKLDKAKAA